MAEPNKIDEAQRIATDDRGSWVYPSLAESGHVQIMVPSLPGSPRATETLDACNFGRHVTEAVERSLRGNPYPKSGPQQNPAQVLAHYAGAARGAKLLDEGTLDIMSGLSRAFAEQKGEARSTYYKQKVRPFLNGLKPTKRR